MIAGDMPAVTVKSDHRWVLVFTRSGVEDTEVGPSQIKYPKAYYLFVKKREYEAWEVASGWKVVKTIRLKPERMPLGPDEIRLFKDVAPAKRTLDWFVDTNFWPTFEYEAK